MESIVLIFPIIIFVFHKKFPGNKITSYLIPKNLARGKHPKIVLRQAGVSYVVTALWIFSIMFVTTWGFLRLIEKIPALLALTYFVLPIACMMCLVIGVMYLFNSLFSKDEMVKPSLELIYEAEKENLPRYIQKIKFYNAINLSCPVLIFGAIALEEYFHIAQSGYAILFNVSLLITFIMTLWRIRAYLVKAALVMDLSADGAPRACPRSLETRLRPLGFGEVRPALPSEATSRPEQKTSRSSAQADKILSSTLGKPSGIFFVWIHSFLIIRKFNQQNQTAEKI